MIGHVLCPVLLVQLEPNVTGIAVVKAALSSTGWEMVRGGGAILVLAGAMLYFCGRINARLVVRVGVAILNSERIGS